MTASRPPHSAPSTGAPGHAESGHCRLCWKKAIQRSAEPGFTSTAPFAYLEIYKTHHAAVPPIQDVVPAGAGSMAATHETPNVEPDGAAEREPQTRPGTKTDGSKPSGGGGDVTSFADMLRPHLAVAFGNTPPPESASVGAPAEGSSPNPQGTFQPEPSSIIEDRVASANVVLSSAGSPPEVAMESGLVAPETRGILHPSASLGTTPGGAGGPSHAHRGRGAVPEGRCDLSGPALLSSLPAAPLPPLSGDSAAASSVEAAGSPTSHTCGTCGGTFPCARPGKACFLAETYGWTCDGCMAAKPSPAVKDFERETGISVARALESERILAEGKRVSIDEVRPVICATCGRPCVEPVVVSPQEVLCFTCWEVSLKARGAVLVPDPISDRYAALQTGVLGLIAEESDPIVCECNATRSEAGTGPTCKRCGRGAAAASPEGDNARSWKCAACGLTVEPVAKAGPWSADLACPGCATLRSESEAEPLAEQVAREAAANPGWLKGLVGVAPESEADVSEPRPFAEIAKGVLALPKVGAVEGDDGAPLPDEAEAEPAEPPVPLILEPSPEEPVPTPTAPVMDAPAKPAFRVTPEMIDGEYRPLLARTDLFGHDPETVEKRAAAVRRWTGRAELASLEDATESEWAAVLRGLRERSEIAAAPPPAVETQKAKRAKRAAPAAGPACTKCRDSGLLPGDGPAFFCDACPKGRERSLAAHTPPPAAAPASPPEGAVALRRRTLDLAYVPVPSLEAPPEVERTPEGAIIWDEVAVAWAGTVLAHLENATEVISAQREALKKAIDDAADRAQVKVAIARNAFADAGHTQAVKDWTRQTIGDRKTKRYVDFLGLRLQYKQARAAIERDPDLGPDETESALMEWVRLNMIDPSEFIEMKPRLRWAALKARLAEMAPHADKDGPRAGRLLVNFVDGATGEVIEADVVVPGCKYREADPWAVFEAAVTTAKVARAALAAEQEEKDAA